MSTVIKSGSKVKVRRAGDSLKFIPYTLTRDVLVEKPYRWATFGGVDFFIGKAAGWEIEYSDADTVGYAERHPARGKPDCPKCSGRGNLPQYAHVQGGKCFACRPILT